MAGVLCVARHHILRLHGSNGVARTTRTVHLRICLMMDRHVVAAHGDIGMVMLFECRGSNSRDDTTGPTCQIPTRQGRTRSISRCGEPTMSGDFASLVMEIIAIKEMLGF